MRPTRRPSRPARRPGRRPPIEVCKSVLDAGYFKTLPEIQAQLYSLAGSRFAPLADGSCMGGAIQGTQTVQALENACRTTIPQGQETFASAFQNAAGRAVHDCTR